MNWLYVGQSFSSQWMIKGALIHKRTVRSRYGREDIAYLQKVADKNAKLVDMPGKHKYIYPLDKKIARELKSIALPYPKKRADD